MLHGENVPIYGGTKSDDFSLIFRSYPVEMAQLPL
jgi:hypothetical protein